MEILTMVLVSLSMTYKRTISDWKTLKNTDLKDSPSSDLRLRQNWMSAHTNIFGFYIHWKMSAHTKKFGFYIQSNVCTHKHFWILPTLQNVRTHKHLGILHTLENVSTHKHLWILPTVELSFILMLLDATTFIKGKVVINLKTTSITVMTFKVYIYILNNLLWVTNTPEMLTLYSANATPSQKRGKNMRIM